MPSQATPNPMAGRLNINPFRWRDSRWLRCSPKPMTDPAWSTSTCVSPVPTWQLGCTSLMRTTNGFHHVAFVYSVAFVLVQQNPHIHVDNSGTSEQLSAFTIIGMDSFFGLCNAPWHIVVKSRLFPISGYSIAKRPSSWSHVLFNSRTKRNLRKG